MFTTGLKQVVINNASQISYDTSAYELSILGVGKIKASEVRKCALLDTIATTPGTYTISTVGSYTTNYAVGDLLSVGLYFTTYRNQGEFAANRKDGVDPLVVQFVATTGTTTTNLASDIAAALTGLSAEVKARYSINTAVASTTNVAIVVTDWSVAVTKIEVNGESGVWIQKDEAAITVAGVEGRGLPTYMEESIKTDTMANRSAYALENDMQLDMTATYMQLNIEVGAYKNTGGSMINESPVYKSSFFNIWLNVKDFGQTTLVASEVLAAGSPWTLTYIPIDGTLSIHATAGGVLRAPADYTVNYATGVITLVGGGAVVDTDVVTYSYYAATAGLTTSGIIGITIATTGNLLGDLNTATYLNTFAATEELYAVASAKGYQDVRV